MKYRVIGPDGVPDGPQPYNTLAEAEAAVQQFANRYTTSGYYATAAGIPIPVSMIPDCCEIEEVEEPPVFDAAKMRRLVDKDRFLKFTERSMAHIPEHDRMRVLFNSYILEDSVMEREYEAA